MTPSRAFQSSLQMLRKSSADVVAYSDAILFGVTSTRNNSLPLLKAALLLLKERCERALVALESERAS